MRARGQGLLAVVLALVVVGAGVAFTRVGPKVPANAAPGSAPSGAWFCPHGGGSGWTVTIYLENPGAVDVTARITSLTSDLAATTESVTVPAGHEVARTMPASHRGSASFVEYFGGWIAAGWLTRGGGTEFGVGAEPCAPSSSQTWYAADNTTEQGQDAYLVVMNPFDAQAVFDVVLYTRDRAPIRSSALTDITVPAQRSVALPLNNQIPGETAVTAAVVVSAGRVVAGSMGINSFGGVRSALAWPSTASQAILPVANGAGQSQLLVTVPGTQSVGMTALLFSGHPAAPASGLVNVTQAPQTAHVYPVITQGPSAIELTTQAGARMAASLRASGPVHDDDSTAGAMAAATTWVVTPTAAGQPSHPGLVLVNTGSEDAEVVLHLIATAGVTPAADLTVKVPASSAIGVPSDFLSSAPQAGVLVTSDGPAIVAMGASTSLGQKGIADYALAMGVPEPATLP